MFVKLKNPQGQFWYVRPEAIAAVLPSNGSNPKLNSWVQVMVGERHGVEMETSEYPEEVVQLLGEVVKNA